MVIFFLVVNFWVVLYAVFNRTPSPIFGSIYFIAFLWLMSWWLREDNLKYQEKWVFDIGILVYVGFFIVIPIYLFKTRGAKALISFFKFAVIYFGTLVIGIVLSILIKLLYSI
jgi:hypothetical protein